LRTKTVKDKIKQLEEDREVFIKRRVENYEKSVRASYQAKIDLLRTMGFKPTKTEVGSLQEMSERGKDRYIFHRERYYVHMGLSPERAHEKAVQEQSCQQQGWLRALTA